MFARLFLFLMPLFFWSHLELELILFLGYARDCLRNIYDYMYQYNSMINISRQKLFTFRIIVVNTKIAFNVIEVFQKNLSESHANPLL